MTILFTQIPLLFRTNHHPHIFLWTAVPQAIHPATVEASALFPPSNVLGVRKRPRPTVPGALPWPSLPVSHGRLLPGITSHARCTRSTAPPRHVGATQYSRSTSREISIALITSFGSWGRI